MEPNAEQREKDEAEAGQVPPWYDRAFVCYLVVAILSMLITCGLWWPLPLH